MEGCRLEVRSARELAKKEFPEPVSEGYVYAMRSRSSGLMKIGRSVDPWTRLEQLSREAGEDLELLDYWPSDSCVTAEKVLHERFACRRVAGEWFDLPDRILNEIGEVIQVVDPGTGESR